MSASFKTDLTLVEVSLDARPMPSSPRRGELSHRAEKWIRLIPPFAPSPLSLSQGRRPSK